MELFTQLFGDVLAFVYHCFDWALCVDAVRSCLVDRCRNPVTGVGRHATMRAERHAKTRAYYKDWNHQIIISRAHIRINLFRSAPGFTGSPGGWAGGPKVPSRTPIISNRRLSGRRAGQGRQTCPDRRG